MHSLDDALDHWDEPLESLRVPDTRVPLAIVLSELAEGDKTLDGIAAEYALDREALSATLEGLALSCQRPELVRGLQRDQDAVTRLLADVLRHRPERDAGRLACDAHAQAHTQEGEGLHCSLCGQPACTTLPVTLAGGRDGSALACFSRRTGPLCASCVEEGPPAILQDGKGGEDGQSQHG
ncbi:MAG: hypothetical protein E6Q97_14440 [Desulfurellales bacterium]|nr:MAG: hypothetical protein E6Q97_14440 [Desulfurellales bacterium]